MRALGWLLFCAIPSALSWLIWHDSGRVGNVAFVWFLYAVAVALVLTGLWLGGAIRFSWQVVG